MSEKNRLVQVCRLLPLVMLLLTGCSFDEESSGGEEDVTLTMDLPLSLTTAATITESKGRLLAGASAADDPEACAGYFDDTADWGSSAYGMTRFLVGLSQSQTCVTDILIANILRYGRRYINDGIVAISDANSGPDDPTHLRYDRNDDSRTLWLFFATPGEPLPSDLSTVKVMYLTWSRSGEGLTGRFIMANWADGDPYAPERLRVDFERHADSAVNHIFLGYPLGQPDGVRAFRVDIERDGVEPDAQYRARGLMALAHQPFPETLPATETIPAPALSMVAVARADGSGAAIGSMHNVALHMANDADGDGTYTSDPGDYMFGTYLFSVEDRGYFDGTGAIEWRGKRVTHASYINTSGTNLREAYNLTDTYSWLEENGGLLTGYFTDTCTDSDGSDCSAFIRAFFDAGLFGEPYNSGDDEPAAGVDPRRDSIDGAVQLDSVDPDGESGDAVYDYPDANL